MSVSFRAEVEALPRQPDGRLSGGRVSVAGGLVAAGLVLFLLFFSRFVHRLRPVAVAALAGGIASQMVTSLIETAEARTQAADMIGDHPDLTLRSPRDGAIQAVNVRGLIRWATWHDCVLAMQAGVGDFVTAGQPVIDVFGDHAEAVARRRLRGMIGDGCERTGLGLICRWRGRGGYRPQFRTDGSPEVPGRVEVLLGAWRAG
jgi:Predicted membrane protein (DUF2254)